MIDLDELERLADAATPGSWHRHTYGHRTVRQIVLSIGRALRFSDNTDATYVHADDPDGEGPTVAFVGNGPRQVDNGGFIAAADPSTVKALIARIRAESDLIRGAFEVLEAYGGHIGGCPGADGPCRCGWREEIVHLRRKRAALTATGQDQP